MDDGRPSDAPGERRLARPPSERYVEPALEAGPEVTDPRRPLALAALLAIVGAVVITVAGGLLVITAGLLVIAGALGWAIAVVLSQSGEATRRRWTAPALAVVGVTLGQVGLWLVSLQEGGTLGLIDYLAETFGPLVPLQLAIATLVAWWQAR